MATTTFSIRIDTGLLERINQAATRQGETRSTYILGWVPETYDHITERQQGSTENGSEQGQG